MSVALVRNARSRFKPLAWIAAIWKGSPIVFHRNRNVKNHFRTFVVNKLKVIGKGTEAEDCGHLRSADNLAGLHSRGMTNPQPQETWTIGPEFLDLPEKRWSVGDLSNQP